MYTNDFEAAFSDFMDRREYDEAENYLFSMVRIAFSAGWQAAGGAPPVSQRVFELLPSKGGEDAPRSPAPEADGGVISLDAVRVVTDI